MSVGLWSLAFAAGAGAAFSPCGVILLPGYLGMLFGRVDAASAAVRLRRGLGAGGGMTTGFLAVFVLLGLVLAQVDRVLLPVLPYGLLVLGVLLVLAGVLMVLGRWRWGLPVDAARNSLLERAGTPGPASLVLYGAAYGLGALSCTLPLFMVLVAQAALSRSLLGAIGAFAAWSVGMGLVVTAIAVATAFSLGALQRLLRGGIRLVQRSGGGLVAFSGVYLIWYWWSALHGA